MNILKNHEYDVILLWRIMTKNGENMAKKNTNTFLARLLATLVFLVLAILLPFLTNQINFIGAPLCPAQLCIILCGFVCGPTWGMAAGIIAPFLRPIIFDYSFALPETIATALELAAFAFVAGVLYRRLEKNLFMIFVDLITAMVCGRLVWSAVTVIFIFFNLAGGTISLSYLWNQAVVSELYAIILQLIVVPLVVNILKKNRLMLN